MIVSLYALGFASRLAQRSKTLPMMPSQYKTHLHWPRPCLSEQLMHFFLQKECTARFRFRNEVISEIFLQFEFQSRECLFHALDCYNVKMILRQYSLTAEDEFPDFDIG